MCEQLRDAEAHPLRGWTGGVVGRSAEGGFERVESRSFEEGER
jgi:hypothetical protein